MGYWYLDAFRRAFDFRGRSSRTAFWWPFFAFCVPLQIVYSFVTWFVLDEMLGIRLSQSTLEGIGAGIFLLHLPPFLALTARRLHDIGKSAWWLLLMFVPMIGVLWLLVMECPKPSEPHGNAYGDVPPTTAAPAEAPVFATP